MAFNLPRSVFEKLAEHAASCLPEECCGILVGSRTAIGEARVHFSLEAENVGRVRREREYSISPLALLEAQRTAREDGLEVLGYYHSHPSGSATPSALDRANAWPNTSYVILGMDDREVRHLKSWRLGPGQGRFVEEAVRHTQI